MVTACVTDRVTVPRLWPGSTVVCLASGPSLTAEDVRTVRASALPTVVINDAVQAAPWAEVLYSSDQYWLMNRHAGSGFTGRTFALTPRVTVSRDVVLARWPGIGLLAETGDDGLERSPDGLRHGKTSGYAAINLAVHLGAARIVLLGYDMSLGSNGEAHFDGQWLEGKHYGAFLRFFDSLVAPLRDLGVTVLNASRQTALTCFPRVSLAEALA